MDVLVNSNSLLLYDYPDPASLENLGLGEINSEQDTADRTMKQLTGAGKATVIMPNMSDASPIPDMAVNVDNDQHQKVGLQAQQSSEPDMSKWMRTHLTKEEHEALEERFQSRHKPSTKMKRRFAKDLGIPLDRVNVSLHILR